MNPLLRASAAHLFVDNLDHPAITEEDEHHLGRVLRLRAGESVTLSDGRGKWVQARWDAGAVEVCGPVGVELPAPAVRIVTAIPKGERCEWMIQKLTEVGVSSVTLVDTARSVVRWDAPRALRQIARLSRIARQAAMQSRRVWLPTIDGPRPLAGVLGADVVVADPDGHSLVGRPAAIVVGPEGGWDPAEIAGLPTVSLGPLVMRVETAALVAAVLLGAQRS